MHIHLCMAQIEWKIIFGNLKRALNGMEYVMEKKDRKKHILLLVKPRRTQDQTDSCKKIKEKMKLCASAFLKKEEARSKSKWDFAHCDKRKFYPFCCTFNDSHSH